VQTGFLPLAWPTIAENSEIVGIFSFAHVVACGDRVKPSYPLSNTSRILAAKTSGVKGF
jgi:hypothetical protein